MVTYQLMTLLNNDLEKYMELPNRAQLKELFLPPAENDSSLALIGRGLVLFFLVFLSIRLLAHPIADGGCFIHMINLPFHEAGHVLFRPFGQFITSLGGTLGQLLMPLICFAVLLLQTRDGFGASVCLWWFGENFLDIAPYIDDARSGTLPLVGGNFGHSSPYGFHDWEYLLTESGLLHYDHLLAKLSVACGALFMGLALFWAACAIWTARKSQD